MGAVAALAARPNAGGATMRGTIRGAAGRGAGRRRYRAAA